MGENICPHKPNTPPPPLISVSFTILPLPIFHSHSFSLSPLHLPLVTACHRHRLTVRFLQERNVNVAIRDERDLNTIRICETKTKQYQRPSLLVKERKMHIMWLDVYIHDYLVKRDLKATAQAFLAKVKVSSNPVGKQKIECKDKAYLSCEFSFFIYNSFEILEHGYFNY
ncbi:uncharacterized protein LOC127808211 [Diospyros lotus]|uniref:uncharacterized protein LOC127808211 n=1 Tax=Diospyros lotus TaxID=55363 RepID=UPI002253EC32|nr:uncharacterized protein LOC127808211 [Diospyros lotus]